MFRKGVYVIGGGASCSHDFLIELIESDTGGGGRGSAPGLYGSGAEIDWESA